MTITVDTEFQPGDKVVQFRGIKRTITSIIVTKFGAFYGSSIDDDNGYDATIGQIEVGDFEQRYRLQDPEPTRVYTITIKQFVHPMKMDSSIPNGVTSLLADLRSSQSGATFEADIDYAEAG